MKLPGEDHAEGMCGLLNRCLYGTRDVAACCEACYTKALQELDFIQGAASPCCFRHAEKDMKCVVRGDDFTVLGP